MTEQEELALYKKALVDWEKPIKHLFWKCSKNNTHTGFCNYFDEQHNLFVYPFTAFKRELPTLYSQKLHGEYSMYHYDETGNTPKGRQQRVTALKNAIEILENKLKQTENGKS